MKTPQPGQELHSRVKIRLMEENERERFDELLERRGRGQRGFFALCARLLHRTWATLLGAGSYQGFEDIC
jgi:hypothetical protein